MPSLLYFSPTIVEATVEDRRGSNRGAERRRLDLSKYRNFPQRLTWQGRYTIAGSVNHFFQFQWTIVQCRWPDPR
jgi:hypothetical protein